MLSPRESVELNRLLGAPPEAVFKDEFAKLGITPRLPESVAEAGASLVETFCIVGEDLAALGENDDQ